MSLPGESHGQRSLVGLSPQCCKELDMTEVTWHAAIQQNEIMECTVNFEMTACCLFDYLASKKYSLLRGNL